MVRSASERNPIIESYPTTVRQESTPVHSTPPQQTQQPEISTTDTASETQFESAEGNPVNEGISFPPVANSPSSLSAEEQEWLNLVNQALQSIQSLDPPPESSLGRLINSFENLFTTIKDTFTSPPTPPQENSEAPQTSASENSEEVPDYTPPTNESNETNQAEEPSENSEPSFPELSLIELDNDEIDGSQLAQQVEALIQDHLNTSEARIDDQISSFLDEQLQRIRESHDRQQAVNRIIEALRNAARGNNEDLTHF